MRPDTEMACAAPDEPRRRRSSGAGDLFGFGFFMAVLLAWLVVAS